MLAAAMVATASVCAEAVAQNSILNAPAKATFSLNQSPDTSAASGMVAPGFPRGLARVEPGAPGGSYSLGDIENFPLGSVGSFVSMPARTFKNFSPDGPKVGVALPEPSSETSLYVLSGLVGLALVVLRRRKLA